MADSDDSDSVLNSARKGPGYAEKGGKDDIDKEFKKMFGDNYDKKAGASLSSSISSDNSVHNSRYKEIEKVL